MSVNLPQETQAHPHHPELGFLRKYIFSDDHKTIGIQFQGFLEDLHPVSDTGKLAKATLKAYGPLSGVNKDGTKVPMQTNVLTGTAVGVVLDENGWPAADRSIDAGKTTMSRWWAGDVYGLYALRELEQTEGGFIRETKDGKIAFEDRHHRLVSPHIVSQATYSDAGGSLGYRNPKQGNPFKESFGIVRAKVKVYTVGALAVLWTMGETGASSPSMNPGKSRTFWAHFPNPDSATNAVGVDVWTAPVASTDYTVNSAADGSGTDITASVSVAVSKFDESMKITLTNNDATLPGYLTLLQARGTPITVSDPIAVTAEDATSIAYPKEYVMKAEGLPSTAVAQNRVDFELSARKGAIPVLTLNVLANSDSTHLVEALTRDVSDRITVVCGDFGINGSFFVEKMSHTLANNVHQVALECSDATPFGGFWVLGTSALGSTTKLAY